MADETRKNLPENARTLIASARNDITIPMFTTVLRPIDDTLLQRGGGKGLALYDEIERDTHAYAVIMKRKLALVARDWEIEPASESAIDKAAAEFIAEWVESVPFDRLCLDLLDATLKGFSIAEIVWKRDGQRIVPEKIIAHDQRRFVFDETWRPRLLTMQSPMDGIELPERKFITHRFGVKGNNPYGLGLGTRLFWPVLFKREGIAFWLTFLEKFASPTPVGKYPMGMLPGDQALILQNLQDMVQAGALLVPMGTEVEFLEAKRAGNAGYEEWCKYWDTQMSLTVFGSTLATYVEGQGSRAASETHKEGEEQIIDADADLLSDTLRQTLFTWLIDYNMPGAGVPTLKRLRPKNESAAEDLRKKRAENMKAELDLLFDIAGRVPPEKFADLAAELAGIDLLPNVPIEVLRKLAPHLASARDNLTAAAKAGRLDLNDEARIRQIAFSGEGAPDAHDHGMGEIARQLGMMTEPMIDDWLSTIRRELDAAVARGDDLAQFADRLLELDRALSIDPMGVTISRALALGELTGIDEVKTELAAKKKALRRRAR